VLEGRTTRQMTAYEAFKTKEEPLEVKIQLFAASETANKHWICDPDGMPT
jgi:hypothetical protein